MGLAAALSLCPHAGRQVPQDGRRPASRRLSRAPFPALQQPRPHLGRCHAGQAERRPVGELGTVQPRPGRRPRPRSASTCCHMAATRAAALSSSSSSVSKRVPTVHGGSNRHQRATEQARGHRRPCCPMEEPPCNHARPSPVLRHEFSKPTRVDLCPPLVHAGLVRSLVLRPMLPPGQGAPGDAKTAGDLLIRLGILVAQPGRPGELRRRGRALKLALFLVTFTALLWRDPTAICLPEATYAVDSQFSPTGY